MSSSASLPSPEDDYAAPLDMLLNKAAWDAALKSVGGRIRALEAVKATWEELISQGTGQALAVIQANVEPQLVALTAIINQLKAEVAAAEDAIAVIIAGGVNMSNVNGLAEALSGKANIADLSGTVTTLTHLMENYVSHTEAQELTSEQKALALSNLGLDDIHNTLTPITIVATAGQIDFALGTEVSPGACLVFHNGAKLSGTDYALTTTTLSLISAAVAGDVVTVIAIGTFEVANALLPAANLADLASAAVARANLGLGSDGAGTGADQLLKLDAAGKAVSSVFPSGSVIGSAYAEYTSGAGHTTLMPLGNTAPTIAQGEEILSISYTPKVAGSKLRYRFAGSASNTTGNAWAVAALFLNGAANAVDAERIFTGNSTAVVTMSMAGQITPSGLVAQTLAVRVGPATASSLCMNGQGGTGLGNVSRSTLIIEEIAP